MTAIAIAEAVTGTLPIEVRREIADSLAELVTRNSALPVWPYTTTRLLDTDVDGWGDSPAFYPVGASRPIQVKISGPAVVRMFVSNDPEWLGWEPVYRPMQHSQAVTQPEGYCFVRFRAEQLMQGFVCSVRIGATSR